VLHSKEFRCWAANRPIEILYCGHRPTGLNHEILDEFQKLGYPIFSQNTLPLDDDILERLFGQEVRLYSYILML